MATVAMSSFRDRCAVGATPPSANCVNWRPTVPTLVLSSWANFRSIRGNDSSLALAPKRGRMCAYSGGAGFVSNDLEQIRRGVVERWRGRTVNVEFEVGGSVVERVEPGPTLVRRGRVR